MNDEQKSPPPTPEYGSYDLLRPSKGFKWPYRWQPTLALLVQGATGVLAGYLAFKKFELGVLISMLVAAAVGYGIGFMYNALARYMKWQQLHWLDLLFFDDPSLF